MSNEIKRVGTTQRWSDAVVHNGVAYLCEVPSNLQAEMATQTQEVLTLLASRLDEVGSSTSCILNATIYIPNPADLAEFNRLWEKQAEYYPETLTAELKAEIRDTIIFYQRRLKSQKSLLSICEFEGKQVEIEIDEVKKKRVEYSQLTLFEL